MGAVRIEKETLVKILDCCIEDDCQHCPNAYKYSGVAACESLARGFVTIPLAIMWKTINALKEQEAKPVVVTTNAYGTKFYHCPKCNRDFYDYPRQRYCSQCGQAVKWE